METVTNFIFLGSKITADSNCSHEIKKTLTPWKENYGISSQSIEKQRHHFSDISPYSQNHAFSSHHIQMSELGHKKDWLLDNWCFQTVVWEKTLESPLACKKIKPVNPNGNQTWIFIGRTDAEADAANTLATCYKELTQWKSPWCWERLRAGGEEGNRGWDRWMALLTLWTKVWANLGDGEGQGSLVCCSSWGHKEITKRSWLSNCTTTISLVIGT